MDQYFNQMEKIIKERKTTSRIRFMLQDVLDLRRVIINTTQMHTSVHIQYSAFYFSYIAWRVLFIDMSEKWLQRVCRQPICSRQTSSLPRFIVKIQKGIMKRVLFHIRLNNNSWPVLHFYFRNLSVDVIHMSSAELYNTHACFSFSLWTELVSWYMPCC